MTKVNEKVYKFIRTKAVAVDETNKSIRFRFSDDLPDRSEEIVDQNWNLKSYIENPIILWGHDPKKPENVLGTGSEIETKVNAAGVRESFVTISFDDDINDKALLVYNQAKRGTLRCLSAGFVPHKIETKDGMPHLRDNELLEISVVPIPANPRAVALAAQARVITKKDAAWLIDSMRSEAEFIEKHLQKDTKPKEKKTMDEAVTKQISGLLDAVTKLANVQGETNARLETLATEIKQKGAVAEVLNADHSWQVQDDKWDEIEVVAGMYHALCEAYFYSATPVGAFPELLKEFIGLVSSVADGSYSADGEGDGAVAKSLATVDKSRVKAFMQKLSEKTTPGEGNLKPEPADTATEPKKPEPKEEPSKTDDDKDDLANGGSDDQPGATDGEIDEDAELTPELQEQIDRELSPAAA